MQGNWTHADNKLSLTSYWLNKVLFPLKSIKLYMRFEYFNVIKKLHKVND